MFCMSEWSEELVSRFAASMRIRRKALGLSAQQLADRTAELGHPVNRSSIAGWENGTRGDRLLLGDAIILATALHIPLASLLYPTQPDGEVEAYPGVTTKAWNAAGALTGHTADVPSPAFSNETRDPDEIRRTGADWAEVVFELMNTRADIEGSEGALFLAQDRGDLAAIERERATLALYRESADRKAEQVRKYGGVVNDG